MQDDYAINNSEWYPLNQGFKLVESCDGLEEDMCLSLDYRVNIQATTGQLKFKDQESSEVLTELNLEGGLEEINKMLKATRFMPACDDTNPGI